MDLTTLKKVIMKTTLIYMNKIGFLSALFLAVSATQAQQTTTPYPFQESSLLWKIEGKNLENPAYLFGTMHLIEKEYFIFPKKLEKLVRKSDLLLMELAGLPNQQEAMKYLKLDKGDFYDYFTIAQRDSILNWVQTNLGMSEEVFRKSFSKMKPFVVVQLATQLHFMGKTESYEMKFEQLALEENIPIKGFETIAEQMALFDNLDTLSMSEMVMESVRNPEKGLETTRTMMQVYYRQQIDSLYMMVENEGGVLSEKQDAFLGDRNKEWVRQIAELSAYKQVFIAVGAGHLGGPEGVIRLLQKEGYEVKPLTLKKK